MVINKFFVDTSFIIARLNKRDQWHAVAKQIEKRFNDSFSLFITDMVITEACSFMAADKRPLIDFINAIYADKKYTILFTDQITFSESYLMFQKYIDKSYSLVDCNSFLVMKRKKIHYALSNDIHFNQAGFESLLRNPNLID